MNSPFPIDLNECQNHDITHLFSSSFSSSKTSTHEDYASSSSNSTSNYPISISPSSQQLPYYHTHLLHSLHHQDKGEKLYASHGGPLDHPKAENYENGNKFSLCKKEDRESCSSDKRMSSKMTITRKMMNSDQTAANTSSETSKFDQEQKGQPSSFELYDHTAINLPNTTIRVCADCNTTKTPLWRSGPRGPKSLCNACGIRQRKARRALAAVQESENGVIFGAANSAMVTSKVLKRTNNNNNNNNSHLPFKKRCKFRAQAHGGRNKKLCVEDLSSIIWSEINNDSAFQQVFPQDEQEAAILLMALSYGLARG